MFLLINALFGNQWIQFLMNNGNFSTREHQCTQNDSARLKILDVKCSKSHYSSSNGVFHGIWTRLKISFFNIMMMLYGTFGNLLAHVTFSAFSSNWIRLTGWKMAKQWDSIWCYFSITSMQLLMIQWKSSLNYAFPQLEETGQVTWNTKSIRNFKTIENSAARRDYKNSYL